jgi:hypothetical protein
VAVIEGKLIPTDQVESTWVSYAANCRGKLLTIPNKVSHLVLASEDFNEVEKIIKNSIYEALEELANDPIPREYRENTLIDKKDVDPSA